MFVRVIATSPRAVRRVIVRCAQWRTGPPSASNVAVCSFPFAINVTTQLVLFVVTSENEKGSLTTDEVITRDVVVSLAGSHCARRLEMPVSDMSLVARVLSGFTPRSFAETLVFHARPTFSASGRAAAFLRDGSTEKEQRFVQFSLSSGP